MTHGMTYKEMLEYVSDTPSCDNCIMSADPYSEACKNCDYMYETLFGLCENAERYKWHTREELTPELELPILVMIKYSAYGHWNSVHQEYESGYLNEYSEIVSYDESFICDYKDIDAWKYIEPF